MCHLVESDGVNLHDAATEVLVEPGSDSRVCGGAAVIK